MPAYSGRAIRRLRSEDGFGLIELTIAMAMMAIALLVLVAALSSGEITLQRSGAAGTAGTLADRQMEKYRAITYASIMLNTSDVSTAVGPPGDSIYQGDSAYSATEVSGTCTTTAWPDPCKPIQSGITGPDNRLYRVDTYITAYTPTGGRSLKVVTVVVRDPNHLSGPPLARLQSRFDQATGQ
jgi:type II secretory pathway pseudopilin PulG